MKNKIIIVLTVFLVFVIGILTNYILNNPSNNVKNEKEDDNIIVEKKYNDYICEYPIRKEKNYTFERIYEFTFLEDKLFSGNYKNVVKFKNKEAYDSYNLTTSEENKITTKFDEKQLVKTYIFDIYTDSNSDNLEKYIEKIESQGFKCNIVR